MSFAAMALDLKRQVRVLAAWEMGEADECPGAVGGSSKGVSMPAPVAEIEVVRARKLWGVFDNFRSTWTASELSASSRDRRPYRPCRQLALCANQHGLGPVQRGRGRGNVCRSDDAGR